MGRFGGGGWNPHQALLLRGSFPIIFRRSLYFWGGNQSVTEPPSSPREFLRFLFNLVHKEANSPRNERKEKHNIITSMAKKNCGLAKIQKSKKRLNSKPPKWQTRHLVSLLRIKCLRL